MSTISPLAASTDLFSTALTADGYGMTPSDAR
jgi:hypothetical protein